MTRLRIFLSRLGALGRSRQSDRDIDDEISSHLAEATEEYIRQGLSPEEALLAARRSFGGVTQTREVYQQEDPKTREQGTDAPGRAISSVGEARAAMDQTDWHEQGERRFLEKLVARLDAAVRAGEAKSLVIAAPPRALGALRQVYTHGLRGAVAAELDKDLVKMPVHEIEKHLAA